MATTTSRPEIPDTIPESGRTLISDITAGVIWGETSLQYFLGTNDALTLDSEFQSAYTAQGYTGVPDSTFAFTTMVLRDFRMLDAVANIDFSSTTDTSTADLVMVTSANDPPPHPTTGARIEGFFQFPGTSTDESGGSWSLGVITSDLSQLNAAPEAGGGQYLNWTLLHEIGHGLGLQHTHNASGPLPSVGAHLDNERYSVMSYKGASGATTFGHAVTPMALDVAALQALYGAETYAAGASTYSLLDPRGGALKLSQNDVDIGRAYYSIWDSGGIDTIDYAGTANYVLINLNAATLDTSGVATGVQPMIAALENTTIFASLETPLRNEITDATYHAGGFFSRVLTLGGAIYSGVDGGYSIAHDAFIENAVGGTSGDILLGNEGGNTLTGNSGDDFLIGSRDNDLLLGGADSDVAAFSGIRADYTIVRNAAGHVTIAHTGGTHTDGTDRLIGVEFAQFDDQLVDLSLTCDPLDLGGVVDFVFLQDLTGSFFDDLPTVQAGIDEIIDGIQGTIGDVAFGASAFRDVGDDFVYQVRTGVSTDPTGVENAYASMVASAGGDLPEAQLTALVEASGGVGLGFRGGSQRVFMVVTDAAAHPYYTPQQVHDALDAANALAIFAVTADLRDFYENFVAEMGCGVVVTITSNSFNLADTVRAGLELLAGTFTDVGDDGDNVMNGIPGLSDTILGGLGDDTIEGLTAHDKLDGGGDNDAVGGGNGNDTAIGGTGNDIVFGDNGNDTLIGGSGNDQLFGDDAADAALPLGNGLGSLTDTMAVPTAITASGAQAVRMDSRFSLAADANIENATTVPHMTITRTTTAGEIHYISLSASVGDMFTFDIDRGGGVFDSYLTLFAADGRILVTADDSPTTSGAGGSTSGADSFLRYTFAESGAFFLRIADFPGLDPIPSGVTYDLHVSALTDAPQRDPATAPGDDRLDGGPGDDRLFGGSNTDLLNGGPGADLIHGGAGVDTATYEDAAIGVTVSLIDPLAVAGGAAGDRLCSIENLTGSAFADMLIGNAGANVLEGRDGDDTLFGGGGGADKLLGGDGFDTVSYAGSTAVVVHLVTQTVSGGHAAGDTISGIEHATGGNGNDRLTGNDLANALLGGAGLDTLVGGLGNDSLDGGFGADRLSGGPGDDTYTVNHNGDVVIDPIDGGIDLVQSLLGYSLGPTIEHLTLLGNALDGTGNALRNTILGNANANVLTGAEANDTIDGAEDNDRLLGGDGNDSLIGGTGKDTLEGGAGNDVYEVDSPSDRIVETSGGDVDLVRTSASFALRAFVEHLLLTGDADASGTGNALANVITGNSGANVLDGGLGNDVLDGRGGIDTLLGGDDDDVLIWDSSDASVRGGAGADTLRVAGSGATVDLVALPDTVLAEIDILDLTGGNNDAILGMADVLAISPAGRLRIDGDSSAVVDVVDASGWTAGADRTIAGNQYHAYTQSGATLLIDTDITTTL